MKRRNTKRKCCKEFSKTLLVQESVLIWITTLALLVLAFIGIEKDFIGELPWLAAMVGFPWGAYGVSQAFYYHKAKAENEIKLTKDIKTDDDEPPVG